MKKLICNVYDDMRTFWLDMLFNLLGSASFAAGLMLFAKSAGLAMGGLSGVGLLINHLTGFPVGTGAMLLNIPLVFFSWKVLGHHFIIKSGVSLLILTLMTDIVFAPIPAYVGDPLLAALFSGALIGVGLGLIFTRGSSTGGTDFLVVPLHKLIHGVTLPQMSMIVDAVILLMGAVVYRDVEPALYGALASVVTSIAMDLVLTGACREKLAMIITHDGMHLAACLSESIGRGATNVKVTGTYTGDERDMLICVCSTQQIVSLRKTVNAADPGALVMIGDVSEVYGEGFQDAKGML